MNPNPDVVIEVAGLRRSYGRPAFEAVRGIDLQVVRGELFALLGTNGAGKTSALEVIEGLATPTAGTVTVLGHDPYADARRVRSRLGMMLQEGGFPAGLTVAETARMWAGTLTDPRPVADVLADVRMEHRRDVVVRQLSGGERRRLDLGLAIMGRPQVLFLDEPTTGLDPESRHEAWDLIGRLLADGTTVLLTTHYLEEAERLADRIAIMHRGRIVQTGTLAQIVAGQPSVITFRAEPEVAVPALPHGDVRPDGHRWVVHTDRLQPTLVELLRWADDHGHVLHDLDARSASLEQAFLHLAHTEEEISA